VETVGSVVTSVGRVVSSGDDGSIISVGCVGTTGSNPHPTSDTREAKHNIIATALVNLRFFFLPFIILFLAPFVFCLFEDGMRRYFPSFLNTPSLLFYEEKTRLKDEKLHGRTQHKETNASQKTPSEKLL
jgi:hypothetical protein